MEEALTVGDRVKHADWDDPKSIPAYRDMIGTVQEVQGAWVRVKWDCDGSAEPGMRRLSQVVRYKETP